MQLHEQTEAAGQQLSLNDIQSQLETTTPVQASVPQNAAVESKPLADLLATAEKENALRRKWAPVSVAWIFVQCGLLIAAPHSIFAVISYAVSLFLAVNIGSSFAIRYRKTTAALAAVDDIRMVGPLLDRLRPNAKARRTRRVVTQALTRLLPRLKASDAPLLTTEQKGRLAHHLDRLALFQRDKEFQIVILRALEQVGDAQAVPVVEKMVQRTPRWEAQERVHRAAVECLPFLLQRAEEEQSRSTLLRSAGAPETNFDELLLPAAGVEAANASQLLRADPRQQIPETSDKVVNPQHDLR